MGNEGNGDFNLHILLRTRDLDIRGIAANNMLAAEYFFLLSEFVKQAPQISESLAAIADSGDTNDIPKSLVEIKVLLESIGSKKFIPDINDIISAVKREDKKSASAIAQTISDDFNGFCTRIRESRKSGNLAIKAGTTDTEGPVNEKSAAALYGTNTLKKVLQLMDHEEAGRKLRILAVDDTPVMLKIISSALSGEYRVFGMTNPKMLDSFLRQVTPELFILDYRMPDLSGFDLVPIIRSFDEHKTTPIIFLTSMGTSDNISTAVKLGACDFMVKPFQAETLRNKVAKHIVRKVLY